jgi:hypothetical protein
MTPANLMQRSDRFRLSAEAKTLYSLQPEGTDRLTFFRRSLHPR